jgi:hypothetical protein
VNRQHFRRVGADWRIRRAVIDEQSGYRSRDSNRGDLAQVR